MTTEQPTDTPRPADSGLETREAILVEAARIAAGQPGGVLATLHAEDATPYVTFVLFHLRDNGEVLFGSGASPQHSRNMAATPEVSFLVDTREVIRDEPGAFDRIVIEGRAAPVPEDEAEYAALLAELTAKNRMAATFVQRGQMFRITPRRMIVRKGIAGVAQAVEF